MRGALLLPGHLVEVNTMFASLRRCAVVAAAAVLVAGVLSTTSYAFPPRYYRGAVVLPNSTGLVNPNYQIYPGLSINQYAYNVATLGRAYSNVPPWAFGYNPYAGVVNYGPVYRNYTPPAYYYSPYYYNPYAYSSAYINPYTGTYVTPYGY
jgi:hypothetical protein